MSYKLARGLEVLLILDVNTFALNDKAVLEEVGLGGHGLKIGGGRVTCLTGTINLKRSLASEGKRTVPYVLFGIGTSRVSWGSSALTVGPYVIPIATSANERALAAQLGAGLDIESVLGFDFFMEIRLVVAATDFKRTVTMPIRFGVRTK